MLDLIARKAIALTDVCYVRVLLVLDLVARKATALTDGSYSCVRSSS